MRARCRLSVVVLTMSLATPAAALAQSATVVGKVTNQSQAPVAGAFVTVPRLRLATQTNDAGVFRLAIPANRVGQLDTLRVVRVGSRPQLVAFTATAGITTVDVTLVEQAVALNEVVVTGTAGNQERRAQAAVVATVDASNIVQTAPITNVQELLTGRVPGVSVTQATGSVGGTSVIRIRGVSSISLSNEPLIFIDGVRADNRNIPVAGGSVSTLNDLNPNEIESMEVVKGPAAATLYGADASAGVIQIITKRGRVGDTRFQQTITADVAQSRPNWTPPANFATCSAADVAATSLSTLCRGQPAGTVVSDNPLVREKLVRNGSGQMINWQGRGGGQSYGYFLSYSYDKEVATVPSNTLRNQSARSNFTFLPRENLTIDAGVSLIRDVNDQVNVGDNIYGLLTALIGNPVTVGTPTNGWFAPNRTGLAITSIANQVTTTRFAPALTAKYQPTQWFSNRLTFGADINRLYYHQFYPKNSTNWYAGNNNTGLVREDRDGFDTWTLDYLGDIKRDFGARGQWSTDLSFGTQVIAKAQDSVTATGYGLASNASNTISSATTISAGGGRSKQRFVGYLGQIQVGYDDRLFLQYGMRVDQNSAFANQNETFYLPKYGVSYVVSEEPFWRRHLAWMSTMRLRAAYGSTGRAPQPGAALQTYTGAPAVLANGSQIAGVVPLNPGNDSLKAERGQEFEAGFETGLFDERLGIDFTYFNKKTRDLLIQRPIPLSLGFTQNPFVNIGAVVNRGVELGLRAQLITTRNVGLSSRFTISTLHNELTSLGGVPAFTTGVNGSNKYIEHYPLGAYYIPRVKSVDLAKGVAVVSDTNEYSGNPIPTYQGTFTSDLTLFRDLRLNGLVEFKGGNKKFNATVYFREKAFTQEARYQNRAQLPDEQRIRLFGPYVNSKGQPVSSSAVIEDYLDDASFVRLRELSLSYNVPARLAAKLRTSSATLTFGGRNLKLWTKYKGGWDPESITYVPTSGVFFAADFLTMPQPQRFFARLSLGF